MKAMDYLFYLSLQMSCTACAYIDKPSYGHSTVIFSLLISSPNEDLLCVLYL